MIQVPVVLSGDDGLPTTRAVGLPSLDEDSNTSASPKTRDGEGVEEEVTRAPSEVLLNQGDPGDVVYVVEEGEIKIVRVRDDRTEELLTHIGPGRYFGELAPMFGIRRSATARATQPTRVLGLTVGEFRRRYRGEKLSELLQKLA